MERMKMSRRWTATPTGTTVQRGQTRAGEALTRAAVHTLWLLTIQTRRPAWGNTTGDVSESEPITLQIQKKYFTQKKGEEPRFAKESGMKKGWWILTGIRFACHLNAANKHLKSDIQGRLSIMRHPNGLRLCSDWATSLTHLTGCRSNDIGAETGPGAGLEWSHYLPAQWWTNQCSPSSRDCCFLLLPSPLCSNPVPPMERSAPANCVLKWH